MFVRWNLTVCSVSHKSFAISLFERPRASDSRTWTSLLVSPASTAGSAPFRSRTTTVRSTVPRAASRTTVTSSRGSACLETNDTAPFVSARWIDCGSSRPESTTTFTPAWRSPISSRHLKPSISGIRRSSKTTSGLVLAISGRTWLPSVALPTTSMSSASATRQELASSISRWSSATASLIVTILRASPVPHFSPLGPFPQGRKDKRVTVCGRISYRTSDLSFTRDSFGDGARITHRPFPPACGRCGRRGSDLDHRLGGLPVRSLWSSIPPEHAASVTHCRTRSRRTPVGRQLRRAFWSTLLAALFAVVPLTPASAEAATYSIVPGGSPVTAVIGAPDENATVTFGGVIGQRISLKMTAVTIGTSICCGTKVSILKPDGTALAAPTSIGTSGGFIDTKALTATGTYTIFVDPQGTATGNMTLTLYDVPPDAPATIVPGGASTTVTTTVPGQNARASFTGSAGQRVSLAVGPSCCTVRVSFLRPDGTTLGTAMTIGTFGGFVDTVALPVAGTYTILVDPQTTTMGSVTLQLYDVPPDVTGTIVAGGATATLSTTVAGQNGRLTFSGTAGQRVAVNVGPTCCSVRVSLLRPDGTTLVAPTTIGTIGGFVDAVSLAVAGTYTIVVDPQGTSTGSVTLRLYDVPPDVTGTIVTGGAPVALTTTVPGQNGRLTFSGTAGQRVSIKLGPTCCSLRVSLLRPDGTTQVAPTSIGTTGGFIDTTTLPVAGTYTIVVDPQGTSTGSATVTLYAVAADVPGTIVPGGAPVTVTTTVPGQNARLTFSGIAGRRVSIKVAPTCCSVKVSLLKPDGTTLVTPFSISTAGGFVEPATLPVTGTYVLAIDPLTSSTGSLTVTLYDVPADVAGTIVAGGAAVNATTTVPGQNARLTFSGIAGGRVSLNVGPSCCNVKVSLLNPDGTTLVVPTTMGVSGGFIETKVLPATGTYSVVVDPQSYEAGSVTLRLYDVPPDATGAIVANGPPVTLSLSVPGQNGLLVFDGTAGQRISVRLSGVTIGTSVCCSSRVSILKPDGTSVVSPVSFGTTGGFIDARTLPVTGAYTIVIDPMTSNTGGVTATVADVPADITGPIVADGTPTTVGVTAAGQNARLTFTGAAAQRVSLQITASCCAGKVSILRPDATALAPATTFGAAGVFVDSLTLPGAGTYTVLVDPDTSAIGSITLKLFTVPPDAAAAIVPGGAPVTVTTTTPGQNARLTFDGVIGQRVSARISTTCCSTRVTLLNPNGTALVPAKSFAVGTSFVDTATLPTSGSYTLIIDPQGASAGSVTVTLYDVPPDVTALIGFGGSINVTPTVPGQNVRVDFDGVMGDGVLVNTGPFNCCSTKMSLLGPTGTTVAGPGSYGADGGQLYALLQASGTYTIFVDPQGPNVGVVHLGLSTDGTAPPPPTLTLSESSPDSYIANDVFYYRPTGTGSTLTVDAATTATGLAKMRFAGLGGGFTPTTFTDDPLAPYSQTYTWTSGATYNNTTVPVTAYDSVGRGAITTFGIIRDATPPVTADNTASIGSGWKNTNQTVILSPLDGAGSGVATTYYTSDGSTPTTASTQGTSIPLTLDGIYTISYFSTDNVRNAEAVKTASTQVRIDKTPPSSAVLNPLPGVIRNGRIVTGSGTDALSGIASISYYYCRGTSCSPTLLIGTSSTAVV